jgi:hypothetical protein
VVAFAVLGGTAAVSTVAAAQPAPVAIGWHDDTMGPDCMQRYQNDISLCKAQWPEGSDSRERCYAEASENLANCQSGRGSTGGYPTA